MNAKIRRVIREIDNTEQKIAEMQDKLKQLRQDKLELENLEIIGMFRGASITTENIAEVMEKFKAFHSNSDMPIVLPKTENQTINTIMKDDENEED